MKIKKLKLKENSNNEYSDYYFIPRNENIKCADGSSLESTIYNLKSKIDTLTNKTNDLIKSAPLVGVAEGINLDIKDSAESRIEKLGIYGNSKQNTTSGKNKLCFNNYAKTWYGVNIDISTNEISMNGTSTQAFATNDLQLKQPIELSEGCAITVKILKGSFTGTFYLDCYNENNSKIIAKSFTSTRLTATDTTIGTISKIQVGLTGSAVCTNLKLAIQIEDNTIATSYEPFTNGASPNPDYPQEIEVITEVALEQSGKNLINLNQATIENGSGTNVIQTKNNNSITINSNGTWTRMKVTVNNVKINTSHIISANVSSINELTCGLWDGRNYYQIGFTSGYAKRVYIPISSDSNGNIVFYFYTNYSDTNTNNSVTYNNVMLEEVAEGVSIATSYEPYHEPKLIPINLNGNKLAKVGDIRDKLKIYRNGNVEIEKKFFDTILSGNEKINEISNKMFQINAVHNNFPLAIATYWLIGNILCNKTKVTSLQYISNNTNSFAVDEKNLYFIFTQTTTLEEARQILNGTQVYYELVTPITITLPPIKPIEMWQGTNIFKLISNLEPSDMKAVYKKDIDSIIKESGV